MADHRGILNPAEGFEHFRLDRQPPAPDLAPFVAQHWVRAWDLRGGAPYTSEVLPYPSFHLVVEDGGTFLYGVGADRFSRRLEGRRRAGRGQLVPGRARALLGW